MNVFFGLLYGLSFLFSRINESEGMECDIEAAIKQHLKFREESDPGLKVERDEYKPSLGCGLCTRDICIPNGNGENKECKQMSALPEFEWETDIFEFGLLGTFIPKFGSVKLTFSEDFNLRILIEFDAEKNLTATLNFCFLKERKNNMECASKYHYYSLPNFQKEECLYVAFGIMKDNRFQFGVTDACIYLASTGFNVRNIATPELPIFKLDASKTMRISFHFEKDPSYNHEGVPILLPCGQGGYAFDQETTRFVEGERCLKIYAGSKKENGISYIIENYYDNDENRYIEKVDRRDKYTPAYTDGDKMTLEKEDMLSKEKTNEKLLGKKREVCNYVSPDAEVNETKTNATKKPMNLDKIEVQYGENTNEELFDDLFIDDELVKIELEREGDDKKLPAIIIKETETTTTPAGAGGAGGGGDLSGSTKCFKNQAINMVLKYVLFLQFFIQ